MKKWLVVLALQIVVLGCSPRVTGDLLAKYPSLNEETEVWIADVGTHMGEGADSLGVIVFVDRGATVGCDSLSVISLMKRKARGAGANVILLTDIAKPGFKSTCWQFRGVAYRVDSLDARIAATNKSVVMTDQRAVATNQGVAATSPDTIRMVYGDDGNFSRLSVGVFGGCGWRLNKLDGSMKELHKELYTNIRLGSNFGASIAYFFSRNQGMRFSYTGIKSSASVLAINFETGQIADYKMRHAVDYFGLSYTRRDFSKNRKWIFEGSVGIGYMGYEERETVLNDFMTTTGATVVAEYNFEAKYCFDENWSAGIGLSLLSGVLSTVEYNENGIRRTITIPAGKEIGLSYLNISLGLTYSINKKQK